MFSSMDVSVADAVSQPPSKPDWAPYEKYGAPRGQLEKKGPKVWATAATALLAPGIVAMRPEGEKGSGPREKLVAARRL